jgi:hypothetical protein
LRGGPLASGGRGPSRLGVPGSRWNFAGGVAVVIVMSGGLKAALLLVAAVAGAAALASTRSEPTPALPTVSGRVTPYPPLLGFVDTARRAELVRVDPGTLRPRRGRRVDAGSQACAPSSGGQACWMVPAWSFAPQRPLLALARHHRGVSRSLRVVDVTRMRVTADVPLAGGAVGLLAWLAPERLLMVQEVCCEERQRLVTVDLASRRVAARRPLGGTVQRVGRTGRELVVLVAPANEIGPARLTVADTRGDVRSVRLERILAGVKLLAGGDYRVEQSIPGLAVDPRGRRVFVVGPELVAEVDLADLAVTYRKPEPAASALSRLLGWLDPPAHAKGATGPVRSAHWLGGGLLAVTGTDEDLVEDGLGEQQSRIRAAGLSLVDTRKWSVRKIDDGATDVQVAGDLLLATGTSFDPATGKGESIGLAAYGLDGRKRFQLFNGREAWVRHVYAGRAYLDVPLTRPPWSALRVVDVDTGDVARAERARSLPWLLLDAASGRWDG